MTRAPRSSQYDEACRYAENRLRGSISRLTLRFGLTLEQWREITRGDWPEIAGRWQEPRPAQPDRNSRSPHPGNEPTRRPDPDGSEA